MTYDFDVALIGSGSAGLFAVSLVNTLEARTCLVEKNKLGTDSTWFGCVPSNSLLKSACVANLIKKHSQFGLQLGND